MLSLTEKSHGESKRSEPTYGKFHVFTHDEGGPQPSVTGGSSTKTIDVVVKTAYKIQCLRGFLV